MIERASAAVAIAALGAVAACALAVSECGGSSGGGAPEDGGALDSSSDVARPLADAGTVPPPDGSPFDSGANYVVNCQNVHDDAGFVTDWPGWRRVTTISDPCCLLDTPADLDASLPPLTWHACGSDGGVGVDASPGCLDIDVPPGALLPAHFFAFQVARDSNGAPTNIQLGHVIDRPAANIVQYELYDFATGAALAAWRNDPTLHVSSCEVSTDIGGAVETMAPRMLGPGDELYATGAPGELMSSPSFHRITGLPWQVAVQEHGTSASTFAFDLQPGGVVERVPVGGTSPASTGGSGAPSLALDFVHVDDVFAKTTSGWTQEYVVLASGSPVLLRSVPGRHMMGFASDGTTLFWTEGYGGSTATDSPTKFEIWAAPYSTDPTALASTAHKLTNANGQGFAAGSTAVQGVYAIPIGNCAEITRIADGELRELCLGPTSYWGGALAITSQELWTIVGAVNGPPNYTVRRFALPSW